ncbi:MAG: protein translocase subunit SecD, partial [Alcanivorax sp.]|nr:protein translocase subunit SecD [Alcanivorax sp.]
MTRYPRWKFFLLLAVLLGCGLYALPNLYPDVPAIQISANDAGGQVPVPVRDRVLGALDDAGIEHGEGETINNSWMVRLESTDAQLRARERISSLLGEEYVVALNLAPTTPDWLRAVGASPMNLGLDLRGGVHFLLQVDMATVIEQRMDAWSGQAKLTLRNEGIRYRSVDIEGQKLVITLDDQIAADAARAPLRTALPEFTLDQSEERPRLTLTLNQSTLDELRDYAVDQNRTALNNRVNELGVGNAVVQRPGADRIVVQLPGVQHASQA